MLKLVLQKGKNSLRGKGISNEPGFSKSLSLFKYSQLIMSRLEFHLHVVLFIYNRVVLVSSIDTEGATATQFNKFELYVLD